MLGWNHFKLYKHLEISFAYPPTPPLWKQFYIRMCYKTSIWRRLLLNCACFMAGLTGLTHLDLFGARISDAGTQFLRRKFWQLPFFLLLQYTIAAQKTCLSMHGIAHFLPLVLQITHMRWLCGYICCKVAMK